jgi:ADP-heptose:LPS heptosyltransferase
MLAEGRGRMVSSRYNRGLQEREFFRGPGEVRKLSGMLLGIERVVRKSNAEPGEVRQVLILEYRLPLGCLVHMTPALEALKRAPLHDRREIVVTVATCGLGLQVLRHSPFIDHLIETPNPTLHLLPAVRVLRRELDARGLRPECVLTGASDRRTTIALLGLFGSSGWRGGYTLRPALYHLPLAYDDSLSLIRNNLRVAKLLECDAEPILPRVFFSEADAATARFLLDAANPEGKPVVVMITQTSGGQRTGWHLDRFIHVIRAAALERQCAVLYVGTSADARAIEAIREASGNIGTSLAGKTSVSQLVAVLALSDFAITLDTGTMHVGRAAGLPMVVLGPSWQKPLEWMPLGVENVRILRGEDRPDVPEGYQLDEISAENVMAALDELMRLYPADTSMREARLTASLSTTDHLTRE